MDYQQPLVYNRDVSSFRHLTRHEIDQLKKQGNRSNSNWDLVLVGERFTPESFQFSVFLDSCYLDTDDETSVHSSRLDKVHLHNCQIWHSRIEDCKVLPGCRIFDSALLKGMGRFGYDASLHPGNETGPEYHPDPGLNWDQVSQGSWPLSNDFHIPIDSYTNQIGPRCQIEGTAYIRNLYAEADCSIQSAQRLEEVSLICKSLPCRISHGAHILRSVVTSSEIEGPVILKDSWVMEGSNLSEALVVRHSILGPNTEAANAEITSSIIGPGIGLHHRSLLIAVNWVCGLGNVASGAQVGSNHTSRAANVGAKISEGWFFGLNSTVQFPLDLEDAPFGLLGAAQRLPPGTHPFPFSLYGSQTNSPLVRPGWILQNNLLSIFRNEMKWSRRLPTHRDYRVFNPQIQTKVHKALNLLQSLPDQEFYLPQDFPNLGPCQLRYKDRESGLAIYQEFLQNLSNGYLRKKSRFAHLIWDRLNNEVKSEKQPEYFNEVLEYYEREYLT